MLTLTQVRTIYTDLDPKPARKNRCHSKAQRKELVDRFLLKNRISGISAKKFEEDNGLTAGIISLWKKSIYGC